MRNCTSDGRPTSSVAPEPLALRAQVGRENWEAFAIEDQRRLRLRQQPHAEHVLPLRVDLLDGRVLTYHFLDTNSANSLRAVFTDAVLRSFATSS